MAPGVTLDMSSDFNAPQYDNAISSSREQRTLLLSPPSISSHPEALQNILQAHNRTFTDLQMLDRLSLGLVSLPDSTYEIIMILTDADGTRSESQRLLGRDVLACLVRALKPGGRVCSQDGSFAAADGPEKREAILAGLVAASEGGAMMKPDHSATQSVPLRFGRKKGGDNSTAKPIANTTNGVGNGTVPLALNGKRKPGNEDIVRPAGVGFVDFSDDFGDPMVEGEEGDDDDDELIDEDTLLNEEDLARPIIQPPECLPKAGKRRRACKDCTCGLKEKLEAEDTSKRSAADGQLRTLTTMKKLGRADLAEVDFTVQGKVGSCGNCALGDAFRCDGCPYVGMPAFKPGEEVRLLNNDVQL
ncbi:MAG: hypothetical protein M1819_002008 [Sarea resinae]|nr:MAG: hypothetical protein M1819_002008 [Sarea resinae]